MNLLYPFVSCLLLVSNALAQLGPANPEGFNFVGRIDAMTLDTTGGSLAGGTLTVDGVVMTVPKNLLVTLPSNTVAWSELFNGGTPNLPQLGTVSWDVTVFGNLINNQYIAGIIYITQNAAQFLQGYISSIDTATGHFTVGASTSAPINSGFNCVLNDPTGVYGLNYTDNPLWSVDPQNPSVHASTGFPMCIPRSANDPACPTTNRPKDGNGKPSTQFTFGNPASLPAGAPDPRIMVPLVVGDFVTFSATNVGGGLYAVYSLVANVGIYTAAGTLPVYVTADAVNYAIVDTQPNAAFGETRATLFTTDPSTAVQWYAIDVDPCTGVGTERDLLLASPFTKAPAGKVVYRLGKTDASPAPRQVGFRAVSGTSPGPQGITAGQFIQPILNYIFPELTLFGAPVLFNSFDVIPYLAQGSGPWVPGNPLTPPPTTPVIVGQLAPWPGPAQAPVTKTCPPPSAIPPPSVSSSAAPPPASSAPPVKDTVTITSVANAKGRGGLTTVTVNATSSDKTGKANLSLAITGNQNLAATPMNNLGGGQYTLSISVKGPTTAVVTSSEGGTATAAA